MSGTLCSERSPSMDGTHTCLVYESSAEHLAALASFHREGLAQGLRCIHVAPGPNRAGLEEALRGLGVEPAEAEERGALLLLPPDQVYSPERGFDPQAAIAHWEAAAHEARRAGFAGIRVSAEMSWALEGDGALDRLVDYETGIDEVVRSGRFEAMCCYDRRLFSPEGLARIFPSHPTVRFGEEVLSAEGAGPASRDGQFAERCLAPLLRQLHRSEESLRSALAFKERLLEVTPAAIYTCDADGRITSFNPAAARLWGRSPRIGDRDERFCGAFRLYRPDGTHLPHDRTPMATALREGRGCEDTEVVMERPDGSRVTVLVNIAPIRDEQDRVIGAINCFFDVTRHERAIEALASLQAQSERQKRLYEAVMGSTPDLAYVFDLDYRFTYANEALLRMWGRTWEEAIDKTLLEIGYEPWHAAMHEREIDEVVATRRPVRGEVPFTGTQGRRIYDYIFVPVLNDAGEVEAVAGTTRDVTDRKQAEEALRESEERFRALTVATADIVFRLSPDWSEIRRLGSGVEESQGSWLEAYVHPDDRARARRAIEGAVRTRSLFEMEHRVVRADGSVGWTLSRAVPILDERGEIVEWFGTAKDTTRRKGIEEARARLQQELRRSLEETETILSTAPIGIAVAQDPEARVITGNPALHRLLDVEPGSNASKSGPDAADLPFRVLDEAGREIAPEELPMQRAAREGIELRDVLLVNRFRDGREKHVVVSAAPLLDEERRSRGAVAAFVDVTEQRRITSRLQEADRRKDEFLAMLSHELRNPLATIRSSIEILRLREEEEASPARRGALGALERQAGTLTRLVDDLLDVSRVTTGRVQVRRDELEFGGVVRCVTESSRSLFEARGQRLSVSVPDEALWIHGDDTRLEQIIVNLLSNAAKYTPSEGRISVTLRREGDQAVLRVRDTGVGIAPELQMHVFDLFAQGEQPLDRSQSGLGIGLALTRSLVELHGGTVEAMSEGPGRGTEFVVRLPLVPAPRPRADAGSAGTSPDSGSDTLRVLFVDDVEDARAMAEILLEAAGHQVRTAADGLQAIEAVRDFRPDAVLLDIGLPGMDGYEVAERIRLDPDLPNPVLIALTGYGQDSDRRRSREAGFAHHLVKPVDFAGTLRPLLASIRKGAPDPR